jgi:hypothetical protein
MPQLPNPKHDAFAYALAKGMSKVDAYVHAGYNDSPPSATRLSQKPEVVQRVQEIRAEMMGAAKALIEVPSEENAVALKDMGLTLDWCIEQYKDIADKAKDAGQFAPANAAIKNIQGIIEIKTSKDKGEGADSEETRFSLTEIREVASLFRESEPVQELNIIDVTPKTISVQPKAAN